MENDEIRINRGEVTVSLAGLVREAITRIRAVETKEENYIGIMVHEGSELPFKLSIFTSADLAVGDVILAIVDHDQLTYGRWIVVPGETKEEVILRDVRKVT